MFNIYIDMTKINWFNSKFVKKVKINKKRAPLLLDWAN